MDELSQILSHEEKNRNIIRKEREKVERELKCKEEKITKMLETEPILMVEEKVEVLAGKEKEIKKIEIEKKKELNIKISKLTENKEEKIKSAVDYIIKHSFKD